VPVIRTGAAASCYQCYITALIDSMPFQQKISSPLHATSSVYVPVLFPICDINDCEFRVDTRGAMQTTQLVKVGSAVFELKQGTGGLTDTAVRT